MTEWGPWIKFDKCEPEMGMYVQVEIDCMACNDNPYRFECIWGLDNSERLPTDTEVPCIPTFQQWRQRKDEAKPVSIKKEAEIA